METERLVIRPFREDDLDDLHAILGDALTMKLCEPPYSLDKTRDFLGSFCIKRGGALAAALRESDRVVGYLLWNAVGRRECELGWFFNRAFWGKGLAFEACRKLIDHAFDCTDINKIVVETADALKSKGLALKLGMSLVRVERGKVFDNDGNRCDLYTYELCKGVLSARTRGNAPRLAKREGADRCRRQDGLYK